MDTIPEFGIKRENEERRDGGCAVVFDPKSQLYACGVQAEDGLLRLFSGGIDPGESMQDGVLREVVEESGLHDFLHVEYITEALSHYYNSLRKVNRVAKASRFLVILNESTLVPVALEEHEKFTLTWARADEILSNWEKRNENRDYDHWIFFLSKAVARAQELGHDTTSTT